jgi:hypothetical protein
MVELGRFLAFLCGFPLLEIEYLGNHLAAPDKGKSDMSSPDKKVLAGKEDRGTSLAFRLNTARICAAALPYSPQLRVMMLQQGNSLQVPLARNILVG